MSEQNPMISQHRSRIYGFIRALVTLLFATILPVRIHNEERINREGPMVLIGNHNSWLDPLVLCYRIRGRQVQFVGKKELVRNRLAKAFLKELGIIAVDRHNSDMEAMRACMRVLRENGILGIFPEGTRHHAGLMDQLEGGAALIALRSKAPLVPVYIDRKVTFFRRTNAYVGADIPFDDLLEQGVNMDTCNQLLDRITETYRQMAQAVRG